MAKLQASLPNYRRGDRRAVIQFSVCGYIMWTLEAPAIMACGVRTRVSLIGVRPGFPIDALTPVFAS